MSQGKQFYVHLVTVKRGGEEISVQATDYELRILKRQHPPENVKVVTEKHDVIEIPNDAALLHDQLCRKYDTKNVKIVERIFPSPEHLGEAFGLTVRYNHDAADAGPQKSVQRDHGREARLAKAAGDGAPKPSLESGKGKGSKPAPAGENLGDAVVAAEGGSKA